MRIGHTSDLHLGRQMHENSLEKDQEHILCEILKVVNEQALDVLLIAGDVYDSVHPPKYAVNQLNRFLASVPAECQVIMIPGNHDLQELVGYGDGWAKNIHPVGRYSGSIDVIRVDDEYGEVSFYPVPFVKPHDVKQYHRDMEIECPDQAFEAIIGDLDIDYSGRNVMILHQNVLNGNIHADVSGSEEAVIGGEDPLSARLFDSFDYVALGHIHRPQNIGSDRIRYCGTPMIYSIDEEGQDKGMTVVELGPKGQRKVEHISLTPLRQVRRIRGNIDELIRQAEEIGFGTIVYAVLTEHTNEAAARIGKFCDVFHVSHEYDIMEEGAAAFRTPEELSKMDPVDLFAEYYKAVTGNDLPDEEKAIFEQAVRENGGDRE